MLAAAAPVRRSPVTEPTRTTSGVTVRLFDGRCAGGQASADRSAGSWTSHLVVLVGVEGAALVLGSPDAVGGSSAGVTGPR